MKHYKTISQNKVDIEIGYKESKQIKTMKQTAVEWLEDCLTEQHPNGSFVWNTRADLEALFKQAKEMEKQQIIDAHGNQQKKSGGVSNYTYILTGEKYYQETFKK